MNASQKQRYKTSDLTYSALFSVLIAIGAWISIPATPPFTMQTFSIFLTLLLLNSKQSFMSILTYILMGSVGIPVFTGFQGGIGYLFGSTGGYIAGFIVTAICYSVITKFMGDSKLSKIFALIIGHCACYGVGTVWFMKVYLSNTGAVDVVAALSWCVIPFIVPDLIKLFLAFALSEKLKPIMKLNK